MRRLVIALCLLAVVCDGGEPRWLLMARHRSTAAAGGTATYYDDDPDNLMQYCRMWLSCSTDEDPLTDESGTGNTGDRSASGTTHEVNGGDAWLDHDGSAGKVTVTDADNLSLASGLTVMIWAKADTWTSGQMLMDKAVNSISGEYMLGGIYTPDTSFRSGVIDATGADRLGKKFSYPATGGWHHYAMTWDGTTADNSGISLYMDGVLQSTTDWNAGAFSSYDNTTNDVVIGESNPSLGSALFDGDWDDAAIFDATFTSNQVYTVYTYGPYN